MQTIPASSALACKTQDARGFAELAARTGLEPDLAHRYATDPLGVLAEFGLSAAEPLYVDDFVAEAAAVVIEELGIGGDDAQTQILWTWASGAN